MGEKKKGCYNVLHQLRCGAIFHFVLVYTQCEVFVNCYRAELHLRLEQESVDISLEACCLFKTNLSCCHICTFPERQSVSGQCETAEVFGLIINGRHTLGSLKTLYKKYVSLYLTLVYDYCYY